MSTCKHLIALDLSSNQLFDEGCEVLCQVLGSRDIALKSLSLKLNQLTDKSGVSIANALRNDSPLISIILSGNDICDAGASAIAFAMDQNASLKELYLDQNKVNYCIFL